MSKGKQLVIVESPTKAKTLSKFLGDDYIVESSVGHIRDLPDKKGHRAPEDAPKWAKDLGINVDNDFETVYVVGADKKKNITELKRLLKQADRLLLATDEDREGEAISWHLCEVLKPKVPVERLVFHEITKSAVEKALGQTREIDLDLVQAQEARRIIDRLYGYKVSPVLWRKISAQNHLSAGRVQSVALKMIVHREWERIRFKKAAYFSLQAELKAAAGSFEARLTEIDGKRLAWGKNDFDDNGQLRDPSLAHLASQDQAEALVEQLRAGDFRVRSVETKPLTKRPLPPFTTSTLQQAGNNRLGLAAKRTMSLAQRLFENGFITYMRTDSTTLSDEAVSLARTTIEERYGAEYLPAEKRVYTKKVANAQEAHEAIRPAGERVRTVEEVRKALGPDEARVYELIWQRTLACQMKDAKLKQVTAKIEARADGNVGVFSASGQTIEFAGYMKAYSSRDEDGRDRSSKERLLPKMEQGEAIEPLAVEAKFHETAPPARLTEATLVRELEKSGIGRPSTYASIIDRITYRYVFKKGRALVPRYTAFAVVRLLEDHFSKLVDYEFTKQMEERLDLISTGEENRVPYLREFYFGEEGLHDLLEQNVATIDPAQVCRFEIPDEDNLVVRVNQKSITIYDPINETFAPIPDELCPDELTGELARKLMAESLAGDVPIGEDPESGLPVYVKKGRFGPYVQLGEQEKGSKVKPKRSSLLEGMAVDSVSLEQALQLLSLPRVVGQDADGVDIMAHNGRYGPYIKRGKDTRSLTAADNLLTIDLPRALELLALEKKGRRTATPLRVLEKVEGLDGADVKVMDGRYGAYITDGTANATLRDIQPDELTPEQAVSLILEARERKGAKKKAKKKTKKKAAKKKAKKKASKKKAAKKKTKKKASKKKAASD